MDSQRPGAVTLTGAFFIVLGVIVGLGGLYGLTAGQAISDLIDRLNLSGMAGAANTTVSIVAIALLVMGLLWLGGGVGILLARSWGRALGLIMGIVGAIIFGLLSWAYLSAMGDVGVIPVLISGTVFVLSVAGVWTLLRAGPYFASRR